MAERADGQQGLIIAIGNAPSSGSTLLADLLDSLPDAVCGPELQLFSVRRHYTAFADIRAHGFGADLTPACCAPYSVRLLQEVLPDYGLDGAGVAGLLQAADDFPGFCRLLFAHYARHRGKHARLFFDKTPENIHCADVFLDTFPDACFLHIVRAPLPVYRSLRRRGFPPYQAACSWLIDVAAAWALRDHPRFYSLRYEDLVRDPDATIGAFLERIGHAPPIRPLKELYADNAYRRGIRRVPSWEVSTYGEIIARATEAGGEGSIPAPLLGLRVAPAYADHFGLPRVSLSELAAYYGYDGFDARPPRPAHRDMRSLLVLARKWGKDFIHGLNRFSDLPVYLRPGSYSR